MADMGDVAAVAAALATPALIVGVVLDGLVDSDEGAVACVSLIVA